MSDKPKSVREQLSEARKRVAEWVERKEADRERKLVAALAEYFADKWESE